MRSLPFAPPRRPINFSGKACGLQGHWQRLFSALSISKPCKRPPLAFACFLIKLPLCGPTERERETLANHCKPLFLFTLTYFSRRKVLLPFSIPRLAHRKRITSTWRGKGAKGRKGGKRKGTRKQSLSVIKIASLI